MTIAKKPLVGVSQCLLGDAVRYDGQAKPNTIVIEKLSQLFELFPVCPEVEAGLPVPRAPVQLSGSITMPELIGRDNAAIDVTVIMQRYCDAKPAELKRLAGFIFKSRSPSCALNSAAVYIDGRCVTQSSRGVFARSLCESFPELAVIEDDELIKPSVLAQFIQAVSNHHHNRQMLSANPPDVL